jgi:hypothetical protein
MGFLKKLFMTDYVEPDPHDKCVCSHERWEHHPETEYQTCMIVTCVCRKFQKEKKKK